MFERESEVENAQKENSGGVRGVSLLIAIVIVLVLVLLFIMPNSLFSKKSIKDGNNSTETYPSELSQGDGGISNDASFTAFEAAHRTFVSAITMYAVENGGTNPQSFNDLTSYIADIDNQLKNPPGAEYDIFVDSNGRLTLTSTYGENELIYTN